MDIFLSLSRYPRIFWFLGDQNKQAHANNYTQNPQVIHERKGFWIVHIGFDDDSRTKANQNGSHRDDPHSFHTV